MSDKSQKMVVVLSHNASDDKSTVAFTVANAALASGMDVGVFLVSDAAELSRTGACDATNVRPFKPLAEIIDGFVSGGGVVWSCAPCFQHRSLKEEEVVDGVSVVGAGPMIKWIADGASTLSF
jgi:predicted peroxiredoxin